MPGDDDDAAGAASRRHVGVRNPQPFCLGSNVTENWKLFKQRWQGFSLLSKLHTEENKIQVATFLQYLADDALKVFNGFQFNVSDDDLTVQLIIDKFDQFAIGEVNVTYERFRFNTRTQKEGESFDTFYSDLQTLVKSCDYCNTCKNSLIRDRIVLGIHDTNVRTELLKVRKLTLDKCIDVCKAAESALSQTRMLGPDTVNKVRVVSDKKNTVPPSSDAVTKKCKFCNLPHVFGRKFCPAVGKECIKCGKKDHFAACCTSASTYTPERSERSKPTYKKKAVRQVAEHDPSAQGSSSGEEWIYALDCVHPPVNSVKTNSKDVKCCMLIDNEEVTFQIDTGSSVNTLPLKHASDVQNTTKVLTTWNNSVQTPLGVCRRSIKNPKNGKKYSVEFVVFEGDYAPLLGFKASKQMGLITVNENEFECVDAVKIDNSDDKLGTLPGIQTLSLDPQVKPTIMPDRRVPVALKSKLKTELDRLESMGVIAPVNEPTEWVSQLVIASKKDGQIRICIDPKELNKALLRERFTLPVLEDTLHEMGQSRVFSKADLASGYWHVRLDEKSSHLTTFQTCFGRYRWLRLPFGLSVSSEIFQKKLFEALHGLSGVVCIADDVIIHGKSMEEHDANLEQFFKRCNEMNIKLNKDKLMLRTDHVIFMGHCISKDGLVTDPDKVKAICEYPAPANIKELRSFLGMVNYLSKFLPHSASVLYPLHNLLKKDVPWVWSSSQQEAFDQIKKMITSSPVLAFYDPSGELTLENDASEYGIGSVLMQNGKPVAFSSRTLSSSERNYAQIEKEMLAIVYGLEKFHHYTYGRSVRVLTDHKPLVSIVNKPLVRAPRRLQSMLLHTQDYQYQLSYCPGKRIPVADALSRAPLPNTGTDIFSVNSLAYSPFRESRLQEIKLATERDPTLTQLKCVIIQGWPDEKTHLPSNVTPYFNYRDELSVQDGIILRGDRVIIPGPMRYQMMEKVHAGHSGVNSCLRRARELIYWPRMSSEIRSFVESCDVCASHSCKQPPEPLLQHEVPERPWEKVGTDLFTIHGRNYLVTADYFSGFIEVDYLLETTSEAVITKLKHHFARHGIPDVVASDNGPQFSSQQFQAFAAGWNFCHETSSPGNPKSNGVAEAAVKSVKMMMKKCHQAKEDPYLGLLNLRNTPQESMTTSPAQRLMGRRTKTLIPTSNACLRPKVHTMEQERLEQKKAHVAERYMDRRNLTRLSLGDNVRMQPIGDSKKLWEEATVSKQLSPRSYEVTTKTGSSYRRNRQQLRPSTPSRKPKKDPLGCVIQPALEDERVMNSEAVSCEDGAEAPKDGDYLTKSGRQVRAPKRLDL